MNFQPGAVPKPLSQPAMRKAPTPDVCGLGAAILPLYTGLTKSRHAAGLGIFCFLASAELKQMTAPQAPMPHQYVGGWRGSRDG